VSASTKRSWEFGDVRDTGPSGVDQAHAIGSLPVSERNHANGVGTAGPVRPN
jgi:hypothetical protein